MQHARFLILHCIKFELIFRIFYIDIHTHINNIYIYITHLTSIKIEK